MLVVQGGRVHCPLQPQQDKDRQTYPRYVLCVLSVQFVLCVLFVQVDRVYCPLQPEQDKDDHTDSRKECYVYYYVQVGRVHYTFQP